MQTSNSEPRDLQILYVTVFLDMVAFAIILPALPFYAMDLGARGLDLGVLLAAYSLAKLIGAAVVGRLSDRFGRRLLLLTCLGGSGVAFVLTGISGSLLALAMARGVAGLFGGTVGIAQAYIADMTAPEQRARYMGLVGAAVGLGFILGPAIGVAIGRLGFATIAFTGAGLAVLNTGLAFLRVKQSPQPHHGQSAPLRRLQAAARHPGARQVLLATFLTVFAFVAMETTLAFVAHDRFGLQQRGFGLVLVFVGTIMILVQGGLVGRLARRLGERRVASAGGLLLGAAMLLLPVAPTSAVALAILGVLALGQGLLSPTLAAILSRYTPRRDQGGVLGLGQSVASAARAVAPLLAGWLYDEVPSAPFLTGGLLALAAAVAIVRLPPVAAQRTGMGTA